MFELRKYVHYWWSYISFAPECKELACILDPLSYWWGVPPVVIRCVHWTVQRGYTADRDYPSEPRTVAPTGDPLCWWKGNVMHICKRVQVPEPTRDPAAASLVFTVNKFLHWEKNPLCNISVQCFHWGFGCIKKNPWLLTKSAVKTGSSLSV